MAEPRWSTPMPTIWQPIELAGWRQLAARPRQLYPMSRMDLNEVGELAAENRVDPPDPTRAVIAISTGAGAAVVSRQRVRPPGALPDAAAGQVDRRMIGVGQVVGRLVPVGRVGGGP